MALSRRYAVNFYRINAGSKIAADRELFIDTHLDCTACLRILVLKGHGFSTVPGMARNHWRL
jgi:hypothetical protein